MGNEGRARVCARRAVGILLREVMEQDGVATEKLSGYDRIVYFLELENVNQNIREPLKHFIQRVDTEHQLPGEIDLIKEAKQLLEILTKKQGNNPEKI